jgi:hypothetical protein
MFRDLCIAIRFFHGPAILRDRLAVQDGGVAALTPIAMRLKSLDVPPRKGGTFCFPRLVVDAIAPMRA